MTRNPGAKHADATLVHSGERILRLHLNEAPWGPPAAAVDQVCAAATRMHLYPAVDADRAESAAAEYFGVETRQSILTTGVDEAVDLCLLEADRLLTVTPGFNGFADRADALGVNSESFDLDGWTGLPPALRTAAVPGSIVMLASPNNPTGMLFRDEDILDLLAQGCSVLLDQTYADFAEMRAGTPVSWIDRSDRVVIFRSFSKSFAMGGLRVGCLLGAKDLMHRLRSRRPYYSVDRLAIEAVTAVLESDPGFPRRMAAQMAPLRRELMSVLQASGLFDSVLASAANFVLAVCHRREDAILVRDVLRDEAHILVSVSADLGLPEGVRFAVPDATGLARVTEGLTLVGRHIGSEVV
jgi:histidinol-phosphate aminotransferase